MKMHYAMAGLIVALAGGTVSAQAAEEPAAVLHQPKGQVFVGQAKAMVPARPGMPLYAGNRVVVAVGGAAKVVYVDGCTVALPENSLLAIGGAGQCKAGQAVVRTTHGFQNPQVGQAPKQSPEGGPSPGPGPDTTGLWITGGALGVAVIAAIASDNGNDNPPASP